MLQVWISMQKWFANKQDCCIISRKKNRIYFEYIDGGWKRTHVFVTRATIFTFDIK